MRMFGEVGVGTGTLGPEGGQMSHSLWRVVGGGWLIGTGVAIDTAV